MWRILHRVAEIVAVDVDNIRRHLQKTVCRFSESLKIVRRKMVRRPGLKKFIRISGAGKTRDRQVAYANHRQTEFLDQGTPKQSGTIDSSSIR